ncbi:hypothetical protein D3C85_1454030 [compost metagenome]
MRQGITEQVFGVGRHIAVSEVAHSRFPGDGRQALYQSAVVILAAAQFLLEIDATGNFRTQATVDPDHRHQHRNQQQ